MVKVTVPLGVPVPGATGETVALKVTGCPATVAPGTEESVVVVVTGSTVWVMVSVEVVKSGSVVA
ncbi:hypothetical protein AN219_01225, partial [Streptomyces nanshensis]